MSFRAGFSHTQVLRSRLGKMASQLSNTSTYLGLSLAELPKSNVFTSKLPPDPAFETPEASHKVHRERLYPRIVKENTAQFKAVVSGNEFFWDQENGGVYPWAQCYGGWQLYVA
ncbi:hypothetical protein BJX76DRAFT_81263 [Aspergillus varians]